MRVRITLTLAVALTMLAAALTSSALAATDEEVGVGDGGPPIIGQIDEDGGISPGDLSGLPGCAGFCMPSLPGGWPDGPDPGTDEVKLSCNYKLVRVIRENGLVKNLETTPIRRCPPGTVNPDTGATILDPAIFDSAKTLIGKGCDLPGDVHEFHYTDGTSGIRVDRGLGLRRGQPVCVD